ncbi:hypothetical protein NX059_000394 [Plenodomus lindquistii]|nr:hypothetical protein NX059_000394 [Plenodomus lindquistii]
MSASSDLLLQTLSISTALLSAGSIGTMSLFTVPMLTSQPASRSLPQIRWLFSRGSHIFPTTALASSITFLSLAYRALPTTFTSKSLVDVLTQMVSGKSGYYTLAAILCFGIAPFTQVMIPTNFELIEINEKKGGSRSAKSEKETGGNKNSAEESTEGKGDVSQWTDPSGPQGMTERSTKEEDERVQYLLKKFGWLNWVRAGLMAAGGVVGLMGSLK